MNLPKFYRVLLILVALCSLGFETAQAQLYSVINKRRVDYFYSHDSLAPNQKKVVKLKVDYIDQLVSDSIMYLGPEFNGETRFNSQNPNCPKTQSRTWIGDAVTKRFRDMVFLNKDGWSFKIPYIISVGSSVRFNNSANDSIQMQITLTSVQLSNYFQQPDSVRIFTINRTSGGNVVPHPFNGKQIIVSKNYGLVKIYGMNNFPYDTNTYYRMVAGNQSMPWQTLKTSQIYNMAVGDEFHFVTECKVCAIAGPIRYMKRKVLNIASNPPNERVFTFGDSVRLTGSSTVSYNTNVTTVLLQPSILDSSTFARAIQGTVRPRSLYVTYQRLDPVALRMKVVDTAIWREDIGSISECYRRPTNFGSARYRFFEGAGGPYKESPLETDNLVYISNGSGTRGTPIYLGSGTVISTPRQVVSRDIAIYPNPTEGKFNVQLAEGEQIIEAIAVSADGRQQVLPNTSTHDLSSYAKGLYQIKIKTDRHLYSGRLVIQ